jgi:hypothetical protein
MTTYTYTIFGKGNFGPFHPMHDPRVTVTLYKGDEIVATRICETGRAGHLWAIEQGHVLPDDHPMRHCDWYEALLAEVRHR